MTVINIRMKHYLNLLIVSTIFSCIEPNSENLWKLNEVVHIETEGIVAMYTYLAILFLLLLGREVYNCGI